MIPASRLQRAWSHLEAPLNAAFGSAQNPLHHLGALTIYFFWIVLVSGLYLFVFFELSVFGAYHSVEQLTHEQWYLGGVMRSLHRYASDAAVLTLTLHVVRELALGRFRGARWYTWFSGVPLIWLVFVLGITGYWLVWDMLAQYVAIGSSRLMDWLPLYSEPMARNFLTEAALSDRFFTLLGFLHMAGTPLMLAFGIWFHILRIAHPAVNPPRRLMLGSLAGLLALSLLKPAVSHEFADLARVPARLDIDWFYLAIYPLTDITSPAFAWAVLIGVTLLLCVLPWLPTRRGRVPVPRAVVDPANCNGCARCVADCPHGAISLPVRADGRPFAQIAQVDPALCTGCGICVGSCPSSTPFRRVERLVTGIDLPTPSLQDLRERSAAALDACTQTPKILVVGCDHAPALGALATGRAATLSLPCTAMLPPAMIDYALRAQGADGVLLTGCGTGDCHFRLGGRWMEERIAGQREPRLRGRVDASRVRVCWAGPGEQAQLREALEELRGLVQPAPGRAEAAPLSQRLPRL